MPARVMTAMGAIAAAIIAGAIAPSLALAHDGAVSATGAWLRYGIEVAALGAVAALYAWGWRALRRRGAERALLARGLAFAGGLVALAASLAPAVDAQARTSFAVHMGQHLLLVVVVAPLLAVGRPLVVLGGGVPRGHALGRVVHGVARMAARGLAPALGRPLMIWILHAAVLSLWHLPRLAEAALESAAVHALEHATLLTAAMLFWVVLVEPAVIRIHAAGVLYLFAAALQCGALGALLATSDTAWYPGTALEDQHLAGALMWVPASTIYLGAALALLARSLSAPAPRSLPTPSGHRR